MSARRSHLFSHVSFWICFSFILWIFAFWGFLSSKLALFEDAPSYYEHIKFYVENLVKGVFPLWDPFWLNGTSNDFFLRRIGAFNPFYFIIVLLESLGVPYTFAYLSFLALYYWAGAIAFYLLAVRIYENRLIAYAGYLILLFSSLGTRLFDSYMMLVTVPLLWFFYFLIAFTQTPRKQFFLGIILSLMILASTYIPLYFLCSLGFFLLFFILFYFKQIPDIIIRYWVFFKGHRFLVILSLIFLLSSFIPIVNFFYHSNKGQIVLPVRHGNSETGQTLAVPLQTLGWGAVEDLVFSSYFSDWSTIRFAVIYIPFFAFIVFFLGFFGRLTRRAAFMFCGGFAFLCCLVPFGLPFYNFLYQHVFFLKYFRNLHFFLWFALIPLFILLVLEHWKIFKDIKPRSFLSSSMLLIWVILVHALIFFVIYLRGDAINSTYGMLILSAIFWILMVLGRLDKSTWWAFALLTLTLVIQPLEVYHYLSIRAKPYTDNMYGYHFSFTSVTLKGEGPSETLKNSLIKGSLYYASKNYNVLYQNITDYALAKYLQNKFIFVDHLQPIDPQKIVFADLEKYFLQSDNKAFVFQNQSTNLKIHSNDPVSFLKQHRIHEEYAGFKVLSFNANHVKIAIEIPYEKFLIYNDGYDSHWKASINRKSVHCYQTNLAFKGVWVPAGKNIVEFHYGSWWQYAMNIILLIGALIILMGIIWFSRFSLGFKRIES